MSDVITLVFPLDKTADKLVSQQGLSELEKRKEIGDVRSQADLCE